jgi:hypothetical protein
MVSCACLSADRWLSANLANKNELENPRGFSEEEQAKQLIIRDL